MKTPCNSNHRLLGRMKLQRRGGGWYHWRRGFRDFAVLEWYMKRNGVAPSRPRGAWRRLMKARSTLRRQVKEKGVA